MFRLNPKSEDAKLQIPTIPKKGWKILIRLFKFFKGSNDNDDHYKRYYQFHVHYDEYKKKQKRLGSAKSARLKAQQKNQQQGVDADCEEFIVRLHHRWTLEKQISAEQAKLSDLVAQSA